MVVDDRGVSEFDRLRLALAGRGGSRAAFLYAFDLLELDGLDLRPRPWDVRRETLAWVLRRAGARICKAGSGVRLSEHLDGAPARSVGPIAALRDDALKPKGADLSEDHFTRGLADWVKVRNPDVPAATRVIEHARQIT